MVSPSHKYNTVRLVPAVLGMDVEFYPSNQGKATNKSIQKCHFGEQVIMKTKLVLFLVSNT